jgi:hypothetical protein
VLTMASAHVTRARGVRSARVRPTPKPSSIARQVPRPIPRKPKAAPRARLPDPLSRQLELIALHLGVLYATCVTVERALKGQGAEQDEEIARCLMVSVRGSHLEILKKPAR